MAHTRFHAGVIHSRHRAQRARSTERCQQRKPTGHRLARAPVGRLLRELTIGIRSSRDSGRSRCTALATGAWACGRESFGPLFSLLYNVGFTSINWLWGIDLGYTVKLGRRVRLWHHGGMVLTARSIGDDVVIRHNTTMGIARSDQKAKRPIIEDRVDVGAGACILGEARSDTTPWSAPTRWSSAAFHHRLSWWGFLLAGETNRLGAQSAKIFEFLVAALGARWSQGTNRNQCVGIPRLIVNTCSPVCFTGKGRIELHDCPGAVPGRPLARAGSCEAAATCAPRSSPRPAPPEKGADRPTRYRPEQPP